MGISALVGLLLASCGSSSATNSSGSSTALRRINAAVGRTEAAGSAHLETVVDTSRLSSTGSSASGAADHLTSVGDIRFDGPDVKTTVQSGNPAISPITTAIYIGSNQYTNASSDPHVWVRVSYRQRYPYLGAVQTTALTTTTGPVTMAGSGEVDGQPATEYLVPLPGLTKTVANSKNQPHGVHIHVAPFVLSVWLDRAGRILRTQATEEITGSQASVERITTTLSNFGEAVQISAPSTSISAPSTSKGQ
jgi:hypothetical protein